jgi:hypothetical protein
MNENPSASKGFAFFKFLEISLYKNPENSAVHERSRNSMKISRVFHQKKSHVFKNSLSRIK